MYREICPTVAARLLFRRFANQKVRAAIMASPIPAGISTSHLPVKIDAAIPFKMPAIMQIGQGRKTAASVAGVDPKLGLPNGSVILNNGKIIAKVKIINEATISLFLFILISPS